MSFIFDKLPCREHLIDESIQDFMTSNSVYESLGTNSELNRISSTSGSNNMAWIDSDDESLIVDLNSQTQLKKLHHTQDLTTATNDSIFIGGPLYQNRLRDQYEKLHPRPNWAKTYQYDNKNESDDEFGSLFSFLPSKNERKTKSKISIKGTKKPLTLKYMCNLVPTSSKNCISLDWNPVIPSSIVTADLRGNVLKSYSLPQIFFEDDYEISYDPSNVCMMPRLEGEDVEFKSFPIRCVKWLPCGKKVLLSGTENYFYVYDFESQMPSIHSSIGRRPKKDKIPGINNVISISSNFMAISEGLGYVAILDLKSMGVVTRFKAVNSSILSAIEWDPVAPSPVIWSLGNSGIGGTVLSQWDLRHITDNRNPYSNYSNCVSQLSLQNAGLKGCSLSISQTGRHIAVGTDSGIVAIVGPSVDRAGAIHNNSFSIQKNIDNLTTPIDSLSWSRGEMDLLAYSSSHEKGSARIASISHGSKSYSIKTLQGWPAATLMPSLGAINNVRWSSSFDSLLALSSLQGKSIYDTEMRHGTIQRIYRILYHDMFLTKQTICGIHRGIDRQFFGTQCNGSGNTSPIIKPATQISKSKKPELIKLRPSAVKRIKELLKDSHLSNPILKIGVQSKGCSGNSYNMSWTTAESVLAGAEVIEQDEIKVAIEPRALISIIGSEIEWIEDELSSQFFFINPNVKHLCGCGQSFTVNE